MNSVKNSMFFRIIALFLIVTFITLDITWAYPADHADQNQNLAIWSNLQRDFAKSTFYNDAPLIASVYDIADYCFGKEGSDIKALPVIHANSVINADLGKLLNKSNTEILNIVFADTIIEFAKLTELESALNEIGFKGKLPTEGVVFVLYKKGNERFLVQIAKKGEVAPENLPGYQWAISDKYLVKRLSENYTPPQEKPTGETPLWVPRTTTPVKPTAQMSETVTSVELSAANAGVTKRVFTIRAVIISLSLFILTDLFAFAKEPGAMAIQAAGISLSGCIGLIGVVALLTVCIFVADKLTALRWMHCLRSKDGAVRARGAHELAMYSIQDTNNERIIKRFGHFASAAIFISRGLFLQGITPDDLPIEIIDSCAEIIKNGGAFDVGYIDEKIVIFQQIPPAIDQDDTALKPKASRIDPPALILTVFLSLIAAAAGADTSKSTVGHTIFNVLGNLVTLPSAIAGIAAIGIGIVVFAIRRTWKLKNENPDSRFPNIEILKFPTPGFDAETSPEHPTRHLIVQKISRQGMSVSGLNIEDSIPNAERMLAQYGDFDVNLAVLSEESSRIEILPPLQAVNKLVADVSALADKTTQTNPETSRKDLFVHIQSMIPESMTDMRNAFKNLEPILENHAINMDKIREEISIGKRKYSLSQEEALILLQIAIIAVNYQHPSSLLRDGQKSTKPAKHLIDIIENASNYKRSEIESDAIVASIITHARRATNDKKVFKLRFTTDDWMPGMDKSGCGTQHDAVNLFIQEMLALGAKVRKMKLNFEVEHLKSSELITILQEMKDSPNSDSSYGLVLTSQKTAQTSGIESVEANMRPFLAEIDPTEIKRWWEDPNRNSEDLLSIDLSALFSLPLEMDLGKGKPDPSENSLIVVTYREGSRKAILLLKPSPIKYQLLKDMMDARAKAIGIAA